MPSPTATTRPQTSAPWIRGNLIEVRPQLAPSLSISAKPSEPPLADVPSVTFREYQAVRVLMSVLLAPQAATRIKTSPGFGLGTGTSSFTFDHVKTTMAHGQRCRHQIWNHCRTGSDFRFFACRQGQGDLNVVFR